jgi:hypothetical protein
LVDQRAAVGKIEKVCNGKIFDPNWTVGEAVLIIWRKWVYSSVKLTDSVSIVGNGVAE